MAAYITIQWCNSHLSRRPNHASRRNNGQAGVCIQCLSTARRSSEAVQFHDFSKAVEIPQSKTPLTVLCNDLQFKAVLATYYGKIAGTWQPYNGNLGHLTLYRSHACLTDSTDYAEIAHIGYAKYLEFLYRSNINIFYNNYMGNSQSTRGITSTE